MSSSVFAEKAAVQTRELCENEIQKLKRLLFLVEDRAARIIQRMVRIHLTNTHAASRDRTRRNQASAVNNVRNYYREHLLNILPYHRAAVTIQKVWRGHLGRKHFRASLLHINMERYDAGIVIIRWWRKVYERRQHAAFLIQSAWREYHYRVVHSIRIIQGGIRMWHAKNRAERERAFLRRHAIENFGIEGGRYLHDPAQLVGKWEGTVNCQWWRSFDGERWEKLRGHKGHEYVSDADDYLALLRCIAVPIWRNGRRGLPQIAETQPLELEPNQQEYYNTAVGKGTAEFKVFQDTYPYGAASPDSIESVMRIDAHQIVIHEVGRMRPSKGEWREDMEMVVDKTNEYRFMFKIGRDHTYELKAETPWDRELLIVTFRTFLQYYLYGWPKEREILQREEVSKHSASLGKKFTKSMRNVFAPHKNKYKLEKSQIPLQPNYKDIHRLPANPTTKKQYKEVRAAVTRRHDPFAQSGVDTRIATVSSAGGAPATMASMSADDMVVRQVSRDTPDRHGLARAATVVGAGMVGREQRRTYDAGRTVDDVVRREQRARSHYGLGAQAPTSLHAGSRAVTGVDRAHTGTGQYNARDVTRPATFAASTAHGGGVPMSARSTASSHYTTLGGATARGAGMQPLATARSTHAGHAYKYHASHAEADEAARTPTYPASVGGVTPRSPTERIRRGLERKGSTLHNIPQSARSIGSALSLQPSTARSRASSIGGGAAEDPYALIGSGAGTGSPRGQAPTSARASKAASKFASIKVNDDPYALIHGGDGRGATIHGSASARDILASQPGTRPNLSTMSALYSKNNRSMRSIKGEVMEVQDPRFPVRRRAGDSLGRQNSFGSYTG